MDNYIDINYIISDLNSNNYDLDTFFSKVKLLNGGTIYNQKLVSFIYQTIKLNNYKI